jgi:hypothetical protein
MKFVNSKNQTRRKERRASTEKQKKKSTENKEVNRKPKATPL